MGFKAKPLVMVNEDGDLGLRLDGLQLLLVELYWSNIRWLIDNGYIEEGRLDWDDVTAFEKVMSVMGADIDVPDDIIGEFAKRGYGEFYPDENKGEDKEKNHSED